ncbi:MAG: DUF7094 domain-containing protein [Halobacteriota archaeon]
MKALPLVVAVLMVVSPVVAGAATVDNAAMFGQSGPYAVGADALDETAVAQIGSNADPPRATDPIVGNSSINETALNRSPRVLDIPASSVQRSAVTQQAIDLGPALGFATNATHARLQTLVVVERIESAPTPNRRQQLILGEVNEIEQRAISLNSFQQETIQSYSTGSITSRELLVDFARLDAEAAALDERREVLADLADDTEDFSLDQGRLASLERELDTFRGPVRSYAVDVLRGDALPTRFYVATGSQSVVLTTIADDTYIREAYRGDLRNRDQGSLDPENALNVTAQSYPFIWDTKQNNTEVVGSGGSYLVSITHVRGDLEAFVDSGSHQVFKEVQQRPLETMGEGEAVSDTKDGLRLTANRTYAGGPLRIRLTEVDTSDPVNANITVGPSGEESTLVGKTGADGELWTISLDGPTTITAVRGNSVVLLTLEPAEAPRIEVVNNSS